MVWASAVGAVGIIAVATLVGPAAEAETAAPTAATGEANPVSLEAATLHGTVNPNGQPTSFAFQYGPGTSYGFTTPSFEVGAGTTPVPVSAAISGLSFGTTYHYRLVATSPSGQASGGDRVLRTDDAVISGGYEVVLTVTAGGRLFGQHPGLQVRRRYRLTGRCSEGSCPALTLRRRAVQGSFASRLRRHEGDRYTGVERSSGLCDDGERFRARASVLIYPTTVREGRAAAIAGRLRVRAGGCAQGGEVATLSGRLVGHG